MTIPFMGFNTDLYGSVSTIVLITCLFQATPIVHVTCKGLTVCQINEGKFVTQSELMATAMSASIVLFQFTSGLTGIFAEL
jgi:hypothetical protein